MEEDGKKLATYETNNYRIGSCLIKFTDGKEPSEELGYTLMFVGNVNDFEEGEFNLAAWLRRIGRDGQPAVGDVVSFAEWA